jgi:hypothetical protein
MNHTVYIHEELHRKYQRLAREHTSTTLYLIGANQEGVCVDDVLISDDTDDGGCSIVPGASNEKLIKGYLELSLRGLVPKAFAFFAEGVKTDNPTFTGMAGHDMAKFPNMAFLTYGIGRGATSAAMSDKLGEEPVAIDIKIIR